MDSKLGVEVFMFSQFLCVEVAIFKILAKNVSPCKFLFPLLPSQSDLTHVLQNVIGDMWETVICTVRVVLIRSVLGVAEEWRADRLCEFLHAAVDCDAPHRTQTLEGGVRLLRRVWLHHLARPDAGRTHSRQERQCFSHY